MQSQQNQQLHHLPHQHPPPPHMMPPQLPMGMGPAGHMTPHHGGPPPYPSGSHQQPHGFSPQLSPMHHSNYPPHASANQQTNSLNGPKELWIFWYGEEPDLQCLVNAQLLNKTGQLS